MMDKETYHQRRNNNNSNNNTFRPLKQFLGLAGSSSIGRIAGRIRRREQITTTEQYQTLCTETDEDNDDNNLRLGSSFSSRRSEILNDINDLRALANEATSEAEQGACKKGVEKKVNDLVNLNQEEEIKGWIGL